MTGAQVITLLIACMLPLAVGAPVGASEMILTGADGPQINTLNLLLPPLMSRPVSYKLQGSNGCFSWSWDHHDLLTVEPQVNTSAPHCSTTAVVASIAPYSGRRATAVRATDSVTGQVLRCEVFIDKIAMVKIFHRSLKLDLDGLATLEVQAFDNEDDTFSSLAGLPFEWQLAPTGNVPGSTPVSHRLLHIPLAETPLSTTVEAAGLRMELETNGLGSDLFVVRGVEAGQEAVTAVLADEPTLRHAVTLTVAEAFFLEPPSPVFILPGTRLQFTLRTLRRNQYSTVKLPSASYHWAAEDSSVALVQPARGEALGLRPGATRISVSDVRVEGHQQAASLHVVTPGSLKLLLAPYPGTRESSTWQTSSDSTTWQLVVGREYVVQVKAYSKESGSRPIILTQDCMLGLSFDRKPWWVVKRAPSVEAELHGWQNASLLFALEEGQNVLSADLKFWELIEDAEKKDFQRQAGQDVRVEQAVRVCAPVKIPTPVGGIARIPWLPGQPQQHTLTAFGGCGEGPQGYRWTSSNPAVASVSPQGVVLAKGVGKTLVRAVAMHDPLNFDEVMVDVALPGGLRRALGLDDEVEVGQVLQAAVLVLDSAGKQFSSCSAISPLVRWRVIPSHLAAPEGVFEQLGSDESCSQTLPKLAEQTDGCRACMLFRAVSSGRAQLEVLLSLSGLTADSQTGQSSSDLVESWTVAAYPPLVLEQVEDGGHLGGYSLVELALRSGQGHAPGRDGELIPSGGLLLALGSSLTVRVRGGPENWHKDSEFVEMAEPVPEGQEGVVVKSRPEGGGRLYAVICSALGHFEVQFLRGSASAQEADGADLVISRQLASTKLAVRCAIPSSVVVLVDEPANQLRAISAAAHAKRGPLRRHLAPHTVINARNVRVAAVALDSVGRPFSSASSLAVTWQLQDCGDLAKWNIGEGEGQNDLLKGRPAAHSWERNLSLAEHPGECELRATVEPVDLPAGAPVTPLARTAALEALEMRQSNLTDAISLLLVRALRVVPSFALLFYNSDTKASFRILGGTRETRATLSDPNIATILTMPAGDELAVRAVQLGCAQVVVRDVGLATPAEASADICVAEVAHVRLLVPGDAALQVGSNLTVLMQAEDSEGRQFDPSQFPLMGVEVHLQGHSLDLLGVGEGPGGDYSPNSFRLRGVAMGVATLHVTIASRSSHMARSDFMQVSVYEPLSIHPTSLVLAPGATHVVTVIGGPKTGAEVRFWGTSDDVATVHPLTGQVTAKSPGSVTLYARAVRAGSEAGQQQSTLSEASCRVLVHVPEAMVLHVQGGRLGIARSMSVFPVGALEGEDFFAFGSMCSNYRWSVGDDQVLSLQHDLSEGAEAIARARDGGQAEAPFDPGFSARIIARSPGRSSVTVTFECSFPFTPQGSDRSESAPAERHDGAQKPERRSGKEKKTGGSGKSGAGKKSGESGSLQSAQSEESTRTTASPKAPGNNRVGNEVRKEYTATGVIWTVPDPPLAQGMCATWHLPLRYRSTVLLPHHQSPAGPEGIPSGKSERSIIYSVMENFMEGVLPAIQLAGGRISTFDRPDVACILAREATTGRAEVATCVRTAEVAQLTVGDEWGSLKSAELSVGATQRFVIILQDEIGAPFYEASLDTTPLLVQTNQPHLIAAWLADEDGGHLGVPASIVLHVKALRQGVAFLRVHLAGRPHVLDFIAVQVGTYVSPREATIHEGGSVNFTLTGNAGQPGGGASAGERGHWASSDESVVWVDPSTGVARAVGEGTSIVSFNGSRLSSYTTISVVRISHIVVDAPLETQVMTNSAARQQQGYLFPVQFSDSTGKLVGLGRADQGVTFSCHLEPSYLGEAKPWLDSTTHSNFCIFFPASPEALRESPDLPTLEQPGAREGKVVLTLGARVEGSRETPRGSVQATFVGGFALVRAPAEVFLGPSTNRSIVTVVGNVGTLGVAWGHSDFLKVRRISRAEDARGIAGRAVYEIRVEREGDSFVDSVAFTLPATGQKISLPVAYEPEGGGQLAQLLPLALSTSVGGLLVGLAAWLLSKFNSRPSGLIPAPLPGMGPPRSPGSVMGTPQQGVMALQSASPGQGFRSPPQPYTDYVSRTIDHTPYYDRAAGKRIDPAFTY